MAGSLQTYQKKRNFSVTGEPRGGPVKAGAKAKPKAPSFVIQKHAASRLHYDFRLELDGVLKSWAVAKGPSLVPGDKRLAVHVEDHPIEYGSFEGTIPKGEYGGGAVMLWDRGVWIPEHDPHKGYTKGHIEFTLEGEKLHGRWHLVRMRKGPKDKHENWLLIKSDDEAARAAEDADILEEAPLSVETGRSIEEIADDSKSKTWRSNRESKSSAPERAAPKQASPRKRAAAPIESKRAAARTKAAAPLDVALPKAAKKAALPSFVDPELATLTSTPPTGAPWLHEVKFDGYRMQAAVQKGKVVLRTRKGLDWTDRFKPIADALADLPVESALIDGEIVVEDENGISDFSGLQKALKEGPDDGLVFYAFDLLHLNGHDVSRLPLTERKALLERILPANAQTRLRYSAHFTENGDLMLKHICRLSAEGVVSKRGDAPYRSGRAGDWLKSKCANRQEFVVIGFTPSSAASKAIGSLVLGFYKDERLVYAGRVGTGFSMQMAKDLYREFSAEVVKTSPLGDKLPAEVRKNVTWVTPKRVAEVEFRGWTGGQILRQASFKGFREDKDAREIVREDAGEAAAAKPALRAAKLPEGVRLTHPDRVLWPEAGVTKEALAEYYALVWPRIEKHLAGRALALVRCPTGTGHCFFQKHVWDGMSKDIEPVRDPNDADMLVSVSTLPGLIGLVQASVLEIHPWGSRVDDIERPDRLTMDLDPGDGVAWPELAAAARETRDRLKAKGLTSFCKTTGGKGLHVVVPLTPDADWDAAKAFCRQLAEDMAADSPARYVATMSKAARRGRIYVDYLRNGRGATAVAAYSTRARPACGVSTPVSFDELDDLRSGDHYTLLNLARRLEHESADPWKDFFRVQQTLPAGEAKSTRAKSAPKARSAAKKAPAKAAPRKSPARKTATRKTAARKASARKSA